MSEIRKYAALLNRLVDMQESRLYAGRRNVLEEAEIAIVKQEDEIIELRTKLAQLELALKVKDELINECIEENGHLADGDDCTLRHIVKALAIQPSQEALDEYVMSRLEVASLFMEIEGQETPPPLYRLKDK